ncbi:MAG TPA: universal stress protein [Marinagarivorans sp.]
MIHTILYASDLGVLSAYSLAYVEQLARQFNAKIVVLHVVPPIDALAAAVVNSRCSEQTKNEVLSNAHVEGLLETIREQAFERLLDDEFGLEFSRYLSDIVIKTGAPAKTIIDYAQQNASDIIVIGNCSECADGMPVLGSVASKVLQMAQIPVFMVPLSAASAVANRHPYNRSDLPNA